MADGGGMFDSFFKKATASVKVMAKDAVQSTASLVHKVAETDVQGVARRLQHKVMEKADANYANVEELPEVESAMLNLKQTDQAYRELHAVLLETFVAQSKAASRQLRAANRAQVIGLDLETEAVGSAMGTFGNHLTVSAERSQELHSVREGADVEERARDDFGERVYDTPAAKLVGALEAFVHGELAQALAARTKYKDSRREASIYTKKVADLESKGLADRAEEARRQAAEGARQMEGDREELLRQFMAVEQRKPALQTVVQAYLQAQLQYHQQCLLSADNAIAALGNAP
uniref:BAR domain-containing protein n=1 Tax=Hemiselmis tepida TaxID=464990 RepID=A0A7S0W645_9CRYP